MNRSAADRPTAEESAPPRLPACRRWLSLAIKFAIVLVLLVGVYKTLATAQLELRRQRFALSIPWLCASGVFYIAGLLPAALYWCWLLRSLGHTVPMLTAVRAHYVGHLGKYVPGKAMVFVVRVGLLPAKTRKIGPAALAVYYETLMTMAGGACLAALILVFWYRATGPAALVATAAACTGILVTLPAVLKSLAPLVRYLKPDWSLADDLSRIHYRHASVGWCVTLLIWSLLGLSFWATLRAILPADRAPIADFPFYVAAVGLAMVVGFASMIPGGAFVREAVLLEILDRRYGAGTALLAALILRIVWLVSEVVVSAILYSVGLIGNGQDSM